MKKKAKNIILRKVLTLNTAYTNEQYKVCLPETNNPITDCYELSMIECPTRTSADTEKFLLGIDKVLDDKFSVEEMTDIMKKDPNVFRDYGFYIGRLINEYLEYGAEYFINSLECFNRESNISVENITTGLNWYNTIIQSFLPDNSTTKKGIDKIVDSFINMVNEPMVTTKKAIFTAVSRYDNRLADRITFTKKNKFYASGYNDIVAESQDSKITYIFKEGIPLLILEYIYMEAFKEKTSQCGPDNGFPNMGFKKLIDNSYEVIFSQNWNF